MDDGMQSWSSFERQRQVGGDGGGTSVLDTSGSKGIDALYVSSSSPDVAPAAASLLRHSGLAAPASSNITGNDAGRSKDEEFRLRFHWMRPHPSLAFAQMDDEGGAGIKSDSADGDEQFQKKGDARDRINPVAESAKLMEAYRYSQVKKLEDAAGESEDKGDGDDPDPGNSPTAGLGNASNHPESATVPDLPLELPKLRINLANLVEAPLMSAWLPGENTSCDADDER